jgi:hypothetical protein
MSIHPEGLPVYPEIEPDAHGWLAVGAGHQIYWETCGPPNGKPVVGVYYVTLIHPGG